MLKLKLIWSRMIRAREHRVVRQLPRAMGCITLALGLSGCTHERSPELTVVVLPASVASAFSSLSGAQLQGVLASDVYLNFEEGEPVTVLVFTDCADREYVVTQWCDLALSSSKVNIEAEVLEEYGSDDEDDLSCDGGLVLNCGTFIPGPGTMEYIFQYGSMELLTPALVPAPDLVLRSDEI